MKFKKNNLFKISFIFFIIIGIYLIASLVHIEQIAYAADTEFKITEGQYDNYTDSDNLLKRTSKSIGGYSTSMYRTTSEITKNGSEYNLSVTADDPIIEIVPKELFTHVGRHLYIGKEYGFFVFTNDQRYQYEEDKKTVTVKSVHNKRSTVLVFDITSEYKIDRYIVTVKPLFQYEYVYITPEENYTSTANVNGSDHYTYKINYSVSDSYIVPVCRMSPLLDKVEYGEVEQYLLKDISFAAQLFNEQAPNDFLSATQYVVDKDNGSFFTGFDYSYSGTTDGNTLNEIKLATNAVTGWLGFAMSTATIILPDKNISKVLGIVGSIIGLPGLLDSTSQFRNALQSSGLSINGGSVNATPLYTTKAHQIQNYGRLIKKAAIAVNADKDANLYYGKDSHATANFTISNSAGTVDTENQTRIVRDIALHIVDSTHKSIQASSVSSYGFVNGSAIYENMNVDTENGVYLLPNGHNYFKFVAPYSSDYNLIIPTDKKITIKINGNTVNAAGNNTVKVYFKQNTTNRIEVASNDGFVISTIRLEPSTVLSDIKIKGNDNYLIKYNIGNKDAYKLNSGDSNIKIENVLTSVNGVLKPYRFQNQAISASDVLTIPLTAGTKYFVLSNTQSAERTTNFSLTEAQKLYTGSNSILPLNGNWNYFKFTVASNNSYVLTFSITGAAISTNILNSDFGNMSYIATSNSITISDLTKNQIIYIGFKNNNSTNENGNISLYPFSGAFKWKIDGEVVSGQSKTLERGSSYSVEFWINNSVKITDFEKAQGANGFSLDAQGNLIINYDCPTSDNYIQIRALATKDTSYTYFLNLTPADEKKIVITSQLNNNTELGFYWKTNVSGITKFTYKVSPSKNSNARTVNVGDTTGVQEFMSIIDAQNNPTSTVTITGITINGVSRPYESEHARIILSTRFGGGSGTSSYPYLINAVRHFNNIRLVSNSNNSNRYNEYFQQTENLSFENSATPRNVDFYGKYEAKAKRIAGIVINDDSSVVGGLFRYNYGEISGFAGFLADITATNSSATVGGMVGVNQSGAKMTCSFVTGGNIYAESNTDGYIGGAVGKNYGTINGGMVGLTIKGKCHMGAFVGLNDTNGIINNGMSGGTIEFWAASNKYIGGVVGHNKGQVNDVNSNCQLYYKASSVSSRSLAPYMGLIIGYNEGTYNGSTVGNAKLDLGTLHVETWTTGFIKKEHHSWDQAQNARDKVIGNA